MSEFDHSTHIQDLLERIRGGDDTAREKLLAHAFDRLRRLARRAIRKNPSVHALEQTDDLLQNAALRLYKALAEVQFESVAHFFALASEHIRQALIDMARHHLGPKGQLVQPNACVGRGDPDSRHAGSIAKVDDSGEPSNLAEWTEFHERAGRLPDAEREVFDLRYYQGLTLAKAAQILGVSLRTVTHRWHTGRVSLGSLPE